MGENFYIITWQKDLGERLCFYNGANVMKENEAEEAFTELKQQCPDTVYRMYKLDLVKTSED